MKQVALGVNSTHVGFFELLQDLTHRYLRFDWTKQ